MSEHQHRYDTNLTCSCGKAYPVHKARMIEPAYDYGQERHDARMHSNHDSSERPGAAEDVPTRKEAAE